MSEPLASLEDFEKLQRDAIQFVIRTASPENGLIADSSRDGAPCRIAATGLGLAAFVVGAERGVLPHREAVARTLTALRFLRNSPQGEEPDATGHRGFYYHCLDMKTGQRTWESELSMIDTAILIAGALTSGAYFSAAHDDEREIRELARCLYERVEWPRATADGSVLRMGWKPRPGFLSYAWEGYSEAILLYVLGLGSPTHPLRTDSYADWMSTYQWENLYDIDFLFAAPLFIHQLSHIWIDFRGIQDAFVREKRSDYFENSRRATVIQQQYAMRNPLSFKAYGENCWGITAGLGPGFSTQQLDGGIERQFYGYVDRAILDGEEKGFVKIHVYEGTDTILGSTIVARHAGEMINEISLAMVAGIGLKTVSQVIHSYPTQAEAIRKAGDAYKHARRGPFVKGLSRRWLAWSRRSSGSA